MNIKFIGFIFALASTSLIISCNNEPDPEEDPGILDERLKQELVGEWSLPYLHGEGSGGTMHSSGYDRFRIFFLNNDSTYSTCEYTFTSIQYDEFGNRVSTTSSSSVKSDMYRYEISGNILYLFQDGDLRSTFEVNATDSTITFDLIDGKKWPPHAIGSGFTLEYKFKSPIR